MYIVSGCVGNEAVIIELANGIRTWCDDGRHRGDARHHREPLCRRLYFNRSAQGEIRSQSGCCGLSIVAILKDRIRERLIRE
ncbi:MAG: hypothetical protein OXE94_00950 [Aestuariivita sp.]|nr:hypothetical protein [Aestuariivita sp.]